MNETITNLQDKLASIDAKIAAGKMQESAIMHHENTPVWSTTNAMTMCSVFLVFGIIILALATYLLKLGKTTDSVLKIFGTILIIIIACFVILAGYSDTQISPVIGLLGTLAGYLLGKEGTHSQPK